MFLVMVAPEEEQDLKPFKACSTNSCMKPLMRKMLINWTYLFNMSFL